MIIVNDSKTINTEKNKENIGPEIKIWYLNLNIYKLKLRCP